MRKTYVDLRSIREQLPDINITLMIDASHVVLIVWKTFEMLSCKVTTFVDARQSSNSEGAKSQDIGSTHVVDVWCHPSAIVQFVEVIAGFMISSNEYGKVGRFLGTIVVLVKISHLTILRRHSGDVEILSCSHSLLELVKALRLTWPTHLKITTDNDKINSIPASDFA